MSGRHARHAALALAVVLAVVSIIGGGLPPRPAIGQTVVAATELAELQGRCLGWALTCAIDPGRVDAMRAKILDHIAQRLKPGEDEAVVAAMDRGIRSGVGQSPGERGYSCSEVTQLMDDKERRYGLR